MQSPDSVRLVPMGEEHLAATQRWLAGSPRLREQIDCSCAPTQEGNRAYWRSNWSDPSREDYAIVVGASHIHLGNCGLKNIDPARRKAELWIYLGQETGKGIGSAALRLLLTRAFEGLRLNRVYLRVLASNPDAARFYTAHGFVHEGTRRQDANVGGRFVDSLDFSLLADEYFGARTGDGGEP